MIFRYLGLILEGDCSDTERGLWSRVGHRGVVDRKVAAYVLVFAALQNIIFDPLIKTYKYDFIELE